MCACKDGLTRHSSSYNASPLLPKFNAYLPSIMIILLMQCVASQSFFDFQDIKTIFHTTGTTIMRYSCAAIQRECCLKPYLLSPDDAISGLKANLEESFFGQHLASQIVLHRLEAHLRDANPSKALVLSFHGWAGSGKTFLSKQIMNALYMHGTDSKYVKFYMSSFHFPDPNKVMEYQKFIRDEIRSTARGCMTLFVFDEVDKAPPGVLDALVPFIDHPGSSFEGAETKNAIFVFLSNTGASEITNIVKKAWEEGRRREDLSFTDFEKSLSLEAFNKKENGLYKSRIIDKALVDFFVPFLPMERRHVMSCIKAEIKRIGADGVDPDKVADALSYWPPSEKLFSQTGCKKVENLVKYEFEIFKANLEDEEDEHEEL